MFSSSRWLSFFSFASLLASVFDTASARHGADNMLVRRHHHQHRAQKTSHTALWNGTHGMSSNVTQMDVQKRSSDAKFTFFDVGLGACGIVNKDSDFIVALNIAQWDGGSHCFKKIQMNYNGKSTEATITDMCPSCPYGGLDLSPDLFSYFASQDLGIVYGSWSFGASASVEKPEPQPSSSKKADPPASTHQAVKPAPPRPSTHTNDAESTPTPKPDITTQKPSQTVSSESTQASTKSLSTSHLSLPTLVVGSTVNITGGIILSIDGLNVTNGSNRGMTTTRLHLPSLTVVDAAPSAPIFETTAAAVPGSPNTPNNIEGMNRAIIDIAAFLAVAAHN